MSILSLHITFAGWEIEGIDSHGLTALLKELDLEASAALRWVINTQHPARTSLSTSA